MTTSGQDKTVFATVLLAGLSYLVGAVPFSYLVARARGVDLRQLGSGNIGAGNVWRACGFGPFVVAVLCDIAKGAAVPLLARHRLNLPPLAVVLTGAAAMIGHVRSIWMGFRGGKAGATGAGMLLAVFPVGLLAAAITWLTAVRLTRITAVGTLAGAAVAALLALRDMGRDRLDRVYGGFVCLAAGMIFFLHRKNIERLLQGTENRVQKFL